MVSNQVDLAPNPCRPCSPCRTGICLKGLVLLAGAGAGAGAGGAGAGAGAAGRLLDEACALGGRQALHRESGPLVSPLPPPARGPSLSLFVAAARPRKRRRRARDALAATVTRRRGLWGRGLNGPPKVQSLPAVEDASPFFGVERRLRGATGATGACVGHGLHGPLLVQHLPRPPLEAGPSPSFLLLLVETTTAATARRFREVKRPLLAQSLPPPPAVGPSPSFVVETMGRRDAAVAMLVSACRRGLWSRELNRFPTSQSRPGVCRQPLLQGWLWR
mmetsp:Transcript_71996/g.156905  ORF Transcript_71996/g.156905 Transcript_71996/m.156905 type:complete len:276 (-) Transcript_71996:1339-2166(-)